MSCVSIVGILIHVMVCTRPGVSHAMSAIRRFLSNLGKEWWNVMKQIFRYLRGTSNLKLRFGYKEPILVWYTDANMVGDVDSHKPTLG